MSETIKIDERTTIVDDSEVTTGHMFLRLYIDDEEVDEYHVDFGMEFGTPSMKVRNTSDIYFLSGIKVDGEWFVTIHPDFMIDRGVCAEHKDVRVAIAQVLAVMV